MRLGMPSLIEFPTIEQNVRLCCELQLDFIELNLNLPIFTPERLDYKELTKIQQEYGIQFTIHLPEELDLTSFQPSIRHGHIQRCVEAIEWAGLAGIRTMNMHLNPGIYFTLPDQKIWINERYEADFLSLLHQSYTRLYAAAESFGVDLCIENTCNFHVPFITSALDRLQVFEQFSLTWDVGHDAKADYREQPILMHYQDRIKHMHLHDCMGNSDHKTLYTGDVPINERIRFAYQKDLSVVIEVKTSEALKESVLKLRAHLHALQEQKGE